MYFKLNSKKVLGSLVVLNHIRMRIGKQTKLLKIKRKEGSKIVC